MRNNLSKDTNIKLMILGWYQIVGGIVGLIVTVWILIATAQISGLIALLFLLAFALYVFSIYCGKLLLGQGYNKGLRLSRVNQALQIFSFLFLGYGFMYISGVMLIGSIKSGAGESGSAITMGFNFGLNSTWQLNIASSDHSFDLGINFVAIYLMYFIANLRGRIAKDTAEPITTETQDSLSDNDNLMEINPE